MEIELIAIIAVIVLVGAAILGSRIGVAAPLLLVVAGIGIGFLPFVPRIEVPPELILFGVLPPLLYSAAVNVPLIDFRRNFGPVVGLSVLLVLISAVIIGVLIHLLVPDIPLAVGVALGAIISPTDAVAATSIGKKLGMPARIISILEGESLVNDATALVLLKTALAAVAGGFAFWNAAGSFAYAVSAAILIGYVFGVVTVWIRAKLENPVHGTAISFIVPFAAFVPAEVIGASGVLAVVVTGLYTGHHSSRRFSAGARQNERLNWHTLQFMLENGVFLLMGLQLYALLDDVASSTIRLEHVTSIALGLTLVLILSRALFVAPLLWMMRGNARRYEARSASMSKRAERARATSVNTSALRTIELRQRRSEADRAHEETQQLGWRGGVVLSWSGMRGVVTLAAAQSLPLEIEYRSQLILIAFLVAFITLLLHGLSLPALIHKLWPRGARGDAPQEYANLQDDLIRQGLTALDNELQQTAQHHTDESNTAPGAPTVVIEKVRDVAYASVRSMRASGQHARRPGSGAGTPGGAEKSAAESYLRLSRTVLDAQRAALLEERSIGRYNSEVLSAAELSLDQFESRLIPPAD